MKVILEIDRDQAERFRDGLADLVCWCNGFLAGRAASGSTSFVPGPQSVDRADLLIHLLREAIEKAK